MKVKIDPTVEVSDEQRKQIAARIDGPGAKKRDATRQEMKDFIWSHGSGWEGWLSDPDDVVPDVDKPDFIDLVHEDPEDEDLIGDPSLQDLI